MVELPPLPTSIPVNPAIAPVAPPPPVVGVSTLVNALSAQLSNLRYDQQLQGQVTAQTPQGVTVTTSQGSVTLATPLPFPLGTAIAIKVVAYQGRPALQLTHINGQEVTPARVNQWLASPANAPIPLPVPLTPNIKQWLTQHTAPFLFADVPEPKAPVLQQNAATSQAATEKQAPSLGQMQGETRTQGVRAEIQSVLPGTVFQAKFLSVQQGVLTSLLLNVLSAKQLPSLQQLVSPNPPSPSSASLPITAPPEEQLLTPAVLSSQITSGSNAVLRLISLTPGAPSPASGLPGNTASLSSAASMPELPVPAGASLPSQSLPDASLKNPLQLTAQVVGRDATGATLVNTAIGTFQLPETTSLPANATLVLELVQLIPTHLTPQPTPLVSPKSDALMQLMQQWVPLNNAIDTVADQSPLLTQQFLTQVVPNTINPAKPLSVGLHQFFRMVTQGSLKEWLGSQISKSIKDQGKEELIEEMSGDVSMMKQLFSEPSETGSWRSLTVPVFDGEQLQQLRFFIREDHPEGSKDNPTSETDTRFVVELDETFLGPIQLDGFVRSGTVNKHCDLVIRSHTAFPTEMQQEIRRVFTDANAITGTKGEVLFQVGAKFQVNPTEEVLSSSPGSMVV